MEHSHCQVLSRRSLAKSKISTCPLFSSRKMNMLQTRRKTYDSPEAPSVRFCNVYFFSSLANSTSRVRLQKRARLYAYPGDRRGSPGGGNREFRCYETPAPWRKTDVVASVVARFEWRARQKKEIITEKGRENGEKIGAASRGRIKVLHSVLVR